MRINFSYRHKEDFDRVMEISDACYSGDYRPPRQTMVDMVSVSDVCVVRLDNTDVMYEFSGNAIVGFAIIKNVEHPYIWNIAVDPAYQRRGIAGNMLREIIKRYTLNKDTKILLHVDATNPAQKLYFDYGFRVVSVEENYFEPNDGLMMVRKLP
jgi:ribosomal protein S18 acetylase RimI-like enzyme